MKKIKMTPIRKKLIEIFQNANKPLSHVDVNEIMVISRATFYRNTLILEEQDIIKSLEGNDKRRYFEIYRNKHAHFICTKCNKIECLEDTQIDLKNKSVTNVSIYGICENCMKKY